MPVGGLESLERARHFATSVKPIVEKVLEERAKRYAGDRFFGSKFQSDPWSTPSDAAVVHGIPDDLLEKNGAIRTGGVIELPNRNPDSRSSLNQCYLSFPQEGVVVHFTPGFIAEMAGTSLQSWEEEHPDLFVDHTLVGTPGEISSALGVNYPKTFIPFKQFYATGIRTGVDYAGMEDTISRDSVVPIEKQE